MKTESKTVPASPAETREAYEAPVVETIETRVEQGVQCSSPPGPGGNPGDTDDPSW